PPRARAPWRPRGRGARTRRTGDPERRAAKLFPPQETGQPGRPSSSALRKLQIFDLSCTPRAFGGEECEIGPGGNVARTKLHELRDEVRPGGEAADAHMLAAAATRGDHALVGLRELRMVVLAREPEVGEEIV